MRRLMLFIFLVNLADNCATAQGIGGVINAYTPVLALNPCSNKITVEDASAFNVGDTVLIIQMKGAVVDSSNTSSFGTITNYKNAGNYEFNYVKSRTGNIIELKNKLTRSYDLPDGKVQLVRVPFYQNATITAPLTCLPWDGKIGGILVLNVADSIILNADIDVSGNGFRGGIGFNSQTTTLNCHNNNFSYPLTSNAIAGHKGESITTISNNIICGKGALAGGGGGGLGHNSGGGGGSNGGSGGFGGYQLEPCGNAPFDNRGIGARQLASNSSINRIFMGGGGGAGQADNVGNPAPFGGNGGGIAILIGNRLKANGFKIKTNGNNGSACSMPPSIDCHDGTGGGGAGGSVLLDISQYIGNVIVENNGGNGANMIGSVPLGGRIGPGGGGGGGMLFVKQASLLAALTNTNNGGAGGVLTTDNNNPWGTTPGQNGVRSFNLKIPVDTVLFRPNIDTVIISKHVITCADFDFKALAPVNFAPIVSWAWDLGDGNTANTQNLSHTYLPGNYIVTLVVTDADGCQRSATTNVIASILTVDAGPDSIICSGQSIQLQGASTGGTQFLWTPAASLNNSSVLNPIATPPDGNTKFFLTATNATGCSMTDSVEIFSRSANTFSIIPPDAVCLKDSIQLFADGGDIYQWTPGNMTISNPIVSPTTTTIYSVQITDTICNNNADLSTTITVLSLPLVQANKLNDIDCFTPSARLTASGAVQYSWTPSAGLDNPTISNPVATVLVQSQYVVKGTDINGCVNYDSVTVNITADNKGAYLMPTGFTPNRDGLNDCYGVKHWGTIMELDFSIYNRWGERVFHSTTPGTCWDGTINGVLQSTAVFVYMVKAKTSCENYIFRKGTFVLIR